MNLIREGVNDWHAGNHILSLAKITVGTGGMYFWGSYLIFQFLPEETKKQLLKLIT